LLERQSNAPCVHQQEIDRLNFQNKFLQSQVGELENALTETANKITQSFHSPTCIIFTTPQTVFKPIPLRIQPIGDSLRESNFPPAKINLNVSTFQPFLTQDNQDSTIPLQSSKKRSWCHGIT
jgi:hypothetical protein